jgi:hypothetical protein
VHAVGHSLPDLVKVGAERVGLVAVSQQRGQGVEVVGRQTGNRRVEEAEPGEVRQALGDGFLRGVRERVILEPGQAGPLLGGESEDGGVPDETAWWELFWPKATGEFFYRNGINFSPLRPLPELQVIRSLEPHMDDFLKTASCNKTKGLGWCRMPPRPRCHDGPAARRAA